VLMIVGLAVLGAGYLGSVATLAVNENVFDEKLIIPLAGPWLSLNDADRAQTSDAEKSVSKFVLVYQGLLQGVGLVLSIIGISQYIASAPPDGQAPPRNVSFQLVPTPGGAFGGLTARF